MFEPGAICVSVRSFAANRRGICVAAKIVSPSPRPSSKGPEYVSTKYRGCSVRCPQRTDAAEDSRRYTVARSALGNLDSRIAPGVGYDSEYVLFAVRGGKDELIEPRKNFDDDVTPTMVLAARKIDASFARSERCDLPRFLAPSHHKSAQNALPDWTDFSAKARKIRRGEGEQTVDRIRI